MNSIKGAGLVSFYHRVALRLVQEKASAVPMAPSPAGVRALSFPARPSAPLAALLREANSARFGVYFGRQGR